MFLDAFHSADSDWIRISAEQGSRFAKTVAGDFNPLHDAASKRFCVPGDLLFALVLARYGLSERMYFDFRGMVGDGVPLHFPATDASVLDVADAAGKVYLHVERSGATTRDEQCIEAFARRYVSFSGRNFPHYLQPLLAEHQVMFNPLRPLVIYDSMGFRLDDLDVTEASMDLADASMTVHGKRADAFLAFGIDANGQRIGEGTKTLIVSGLRPYDEAAMAAFIEAFPGGA